ncbi:TIR domain-containing protein [Paenarthrobacter nicotinovorans]|uniref:TIR domain-containing protein n=1 Tax=Paenarthrobacter nicotinovorans TaxID=29320 RepID=UPI003A7F6D3D
MISLDNLLQPFAKYASRQYEGAEWEGFLERTGKFDLGDDAAFEDLKTWPAGEAGYIRSVLSFIKGKFQLLGTTDRERLETLEKGVPDLMEWALFVTSDQNAQDSFVMFLKQNWEILPADWQEGARNFDSAEFPEEVIIEAATPARSGNGSAPTKMPSPQQKPESTIRRAAATKSSDLKEVNMPSTTNEPDRQIFIVHGHNEHRKAELDAFLMRITGKHPVILHRENNRGSSLIEKLERSASSAGFAVILLTADDLGRSKNVTDERPRGRQNVVFEMGYFMAKLGRENVAILREDGVEEPGDVTGMVYIPLDGGNWRKELADELDASGYDIDWKAV